jgi:cyclopropane-fatty-acyl-phospholipid synthase
MKQVFQDLLAQADVEIDGDRPWDIHVHDDAFYKRALTGGSLALGESFMDGWWSCAALDQFFDRVLRARLDRSVVPLSAKLLLARSKIVNLQSKIGARQVIDTHYQLSAKLFMSFLDPFNQYTCGYWKDADNLNQAQEDKLDLICRKLQIQEGDRVLDIGCGWGGFARFAASRYGARVTGLTISDNQLAYAQDLCAGLPVTFVKSDYRDFTDTGFDKVLVCGMIEHVGYKNYRSLFEVAHRSLKDGGLFLLHTIGRHRSGTNTDAWMHKYIFPNAMMPSPVQLTTAAERLFALNDWHSFGAYYDPTLMAWHENFVAAWDDLKSDYDDRFFRMWSYYLLMCAGTFRSNKKQLWQIVWAKRRGARAGYESVR